MKSRTFAVVDIESPQFLGDMARVVESPEVFFVLKWTEDTPIVLWELRVGPVGEKIRSVIETVVHDHDGDLEVNLGRFDKPIEIVFSLSAIESVSHAAACVWQRGRRPEKVAPKGDGLKEIKRGASWTETVTFTPL